MFVVFFLLLLLECDGGCLEAVESAVVAADEIDLEVIVVVFGGVVSRRLPLLLVFALPPLLAFPPPLVLLHPGQEPFFQPLLLDLLLPEPGGLPLFPLPATPAAVRIVTPVVVTVVNNAVAEKVAGIVVIAREHDDAVLMVYCCCFLFYLWVYVFVMPWLCRSSSMRTAMGIEKRRICCASPDTIPSNGFGF